MSRGDNDIGKAAVAPHHIELTKNTPIWQKPRTFADPLNAEIEAQCRELLEQGILEYSDSKWSSPVVPVRKPDGSLRLCVDYQKVSKVTETQQFPMPNLSNSIYKGHNVKYFTKLDLVRGYYQVPLDEDSKEITAFSTIKNHFQFNRLSFGLKNSGIGFQKIMQQLLDPLCSQNVICYIEDILIMSVSFEEHVKLVSRVLATLLKFNMKVKVKKCEFFMTEVNFLGHLISSEGIKKSPEYMEKVQNFVRPETVTQLRQFLGLANFQRKFVNEFSIIAKPLSEITGGQKRKRIEWTEQRIEAFEKLKEELTKEVVLSYPDYQEHSNPLELYVDASGTGSGACLMQQQNENYKTIAYASMTFSDAQRKYSTTERELVAIRWGLKVFKPFVYGVKFCLFTDHRPLIYLHSMAPHNSTIRRTLEEITEYDLEIRYRPGLMNEAADCLSRMER